MAMKTTVCEKCKRVLQNVNAYHYCKEVAIDDLFINKPDNVVLIFDRLLQAVAEWNDVAISATKNCVVFVRKKTFLVAKPMRTCLEVKFYSNNVIEDELLYKCQLWNSKYEGILRLQDEAELSVKFLNYIKESYDIS
jgi:Domain of unknown function (DUF5655)